MSRSETNESRAAGVADAPEPLRMFTSALHEGLVLGLSALQTALSPGVGGADTERATGSAILPNDADIVSATAHFYLIAAASGLRYWSGLSRIVASHQSGILTSVLSKAVGTNLSEGERRNLAEDFRTYLREVSDLSLQEARLLEAELAQLGERVASGMERSEGDAAHRRRWKAKP